MKKNFIIQARPRNTLLVFSYECLPDKKVWFEEKYIGAEVHCFLDRDIKNTNELSKAEMDARDFLARSGWIVKEQLEDPLWQKMPCRFRCLFSKVLKARRTAMEIARQDGISFIAYTWETDDTAPGGKQMSLIDNYNKCLQLIRQEKWSKAKKVISSEPAVEKMP